ncbi:hypothetical protein TURU_093012 [Turdus rufiventris]|nr:hypothetical protein TURU_093012 [Turdus rufiventris]
MVTQCNFPGCKSFQEVQEPDRNVTGQQRKINKNGTNTSFPFLITLYLSCNDAKAVDCSPGEDGCIDGTVLPGLMTTGANLLAASSVLVSLEKRTICNCLVGNLVWIRNLSTPKEIWLISHRHYEALQVAGEDAIKIIAISLG